MKRRPKGHVDSDLGVTPLGSLTPEEGMTLRKEDQAGPKVSESRIQAVDASSTKRGLKPGALGLKPGALGLVRAPHSNDTA